MFSLNSAGNNVKWFCVFIGLECSGERLLRTSQHLKSRFQQGERKGETIIVAFGKDRYFSLVRIQ
jgi:hypothetical protein